MPDVAIGSVWKVKIGEKDMVALVVSAASDDRTDESIEVGVGTFDCKMPGNPEYRRLPYWWFRWCAITKLTKSDLLEHTGNVSSENIVRALTFGRIDSRWPDVDAIPVDMDLDKMMTISIPVLYDPSPVAIS